MRTLTERFEEVVKRSEANATIIDDDMLLREKIFPIVKTFERLELINFWERLEMFVHDVEVNDMMSEEEKQMILRYSKELHKPSEP